MRAPIAVIDRVLDDEVCRALVTRIERLGPRPTHVRTPFGAARDEAQRNNTRVWFDDAALAAGVFDAIGAEVAILIARWPGWCAGTPVGCTHAFRGYRYRAGERFALHVDQPEVTALDGVAGGVAGAAGGAREGRTAFSALVYLTDARDGLAGGATRFEGAGPDGGDVVIAPARGRAVVFAHALPHEGGVVEAGVKYAVRTNVVVA